MIENEVDLKNLEASPSQFVYLTARITDNIIMHGRRMDLPTLTDQEIKIRNCIGFGDQHWLHPVTLTDQNGALSGRC
jgi:hypothetical protein